MNEALSLACELEAFRLLDSDLRRSSSKVRSMDEVDREPDLFKAQMELLCSDLHAQQQCQETQQVALQELVQQIQQLSQSMSLNTSENQQRQPFLSYSNRNGPCWDCKEFGHLVIAVVTAQHVSHMNEPNWVRETPAGCRPRARGMPE